MCAGASKEVVVTPHDSFGNPSAGGGRFAAELAEEEGAPPEVIPCQVTESTTGGPPALLELTVSEHLSRLNSSIVAPTLRRQDA